MTSVPPDHSTSGIEDQVRRINAAGDEFVISAIADDSLTMTVWDGDSYREPLMFTFTATVYVCLPPEFIGVLRVEGIDGSEVLRAQNHLNAEDRIFSFYARHAVPNHGKPVQHHGDELSFGTWMERRVGWVSARGIVMNAR